MTKVRDYLYDFPPLIEVVAELHWRIQPINLFPGAGVDPFFQIIRENLTSLLAAVGFPYVENIVPKGIPQELLAYKPVVRLRPAENQWPLYQLGPGLLAINITPPYRGWLDFRKTIEFGLTKLYEAMPDPEKFLHLKKFELRYVDAFTAKHGFRTYPEFTEKCLLAGVTLSETITKRTTLVFGGITKVFEVRAPLSSIAETVGSIKVAPGVIRDENVAIAELKMLSEFNAKFCSTKQVLEWLDLAQDELNIWFEALVSDDLRKTFGSRTDI
jgi:uncharacterized protein (TIGR04255 family)